MNPKTAKLFGLEVSYLIVSMRMTDLSVLTVTFTVLLTGMKKNINVLFVTEIVVHA